MVSVSSLGALSTSTKKAAKEQEMKKLSDNILKDFQKMLDINPRQYAKVMDQIPHKFPQDAPIFGKPNVLINPA